MASEEFIAQPPISRNDVGSSDGEAPEEVSHVAAATAAANVLKNERVAVAGISKERRGRRRARALAREAASVLRTEKRAKKARKEAAFQPIISVEVLERAAVALEEQENRAKSVLENKTVTSFVDPTLSSRSVGNYRVVSIGKQSSLAKKRKVGRKALKFMARAFNAVERVPAREAARIRKKRNKELEQEGKNRF